MAAGSGNDEHNTLSERRGGRGDGGEEGTFLSFAACCRCPSGSGCRCITALVGRRHSQSDASAAAQ